MQARVKAPGSVSDRSETVERIASRQSKVCILRGCSCRGVGLAATSRVGGGLENLDRLFRRLNCGLKAAAVIGP